MSMFYNGTKHNALDDARHQARWLTKILLYKQGADITVKQLLNHVGLPIDKITP